tara:strand:- start:39 stop:251 length:213 start_codon:yes stop_codon:yes gene_type:complete
MTEDWTEFGKIVCYAKNVGWHLRVLDGVLWFHKKGGEGIGMYANTRYKSYEDLGYIGAIKEAYEEVTDAK